MEMKQDDLKTTTPPPTDALSEAPAPSTVEPPVDSPAPRPPSVFAAVVVDAQQVCRYDVRDVRLDDLDEVHEQTIIVFQNKIQLERAHRVGLSGPDLAWRTEIHTREIEVAVAKLRQLGAFLGPVPDDCQADDDRRPG